MHHDPVTNADLEVDGADFLEGQSIGLLGGWFALSKFPSFEQFMESLLTETGYVSIRVEQALGWEGPLKQHR